ncbi:retrovirus-related pol polyprotein from transposon TNT 1-94 [Tanacetum coccineum]|uniref:Retrovirus-related pol polyprotein from transposon TNT 1-94 n=1 Tax=Tanacetum coccineum TaxID=301880 RepID=A0ABQ5EG12_9ASTR
MEALNYVGSHNMVAYLEKSLENVDFDEIVDFLNANPIRYALTTIVISESSVRRDLQFNDKDGIACLINTEIFENLQLIGYENLSDRLTFLQLILNYQIENLEAIFNDEYAPPSHTKKVFAKMRRERKDFSGRVTPFFETMLIQHPTKVGEGSGQSTEPQHTPTTASPSNIEPMPIVASSSQPQKTQKHRKTKRKATEISQSSGPTTLVADETVYKEREDRMERAATTASSLEAEHDSGNIFRTQSMATLNEPIPQGTGSGSGPRCQDTILEDKPAQTRVLDLENVKDAQALEIKQLKKRVKKLEKKKKSRTLQLKRRLFKVRIESSTDKSLEDAETQRRYGISTAGVTTAEPVTTASAPITIAGVFHNVGDGSNTSIWYDRWCSNYPLAASISTRDMFRTSLNPSSKLRDIIFNGAFSWPPVLSDKYSFLQSIIMLNVLDRRDLLEWRNELRLVKPFSVSMVWSCIRPRGDKVSWFDVVWFSYCIPRHAVNLWLIMKQRLKTQDKLSSWDVSGSLMTSWMNSVGPIFTQIVSAIMPFAKRKSSRSVIAKLVLAACAYFVWQERNERLFKNSTRSVKQVIDFIMSLVHLKLLTCRFRRTKDGEFFAALWSLPDAIFI